MLDVSVYTLYTNPSEHTYILMQKQTIDNMKERFNAISERFIEQLESKNISSSQMMKDGVIKSRSSITNIRFGRQGVSLKMLEDCARLYGIDKTYVLLGDSGDDVNSGGGPIMMNTSNSTIIGSNNNGNSNTKISTVQPVGSYYREELINVPFVQQDAAASFIEHFGDTEHSCTEFYGVMPEEGEDISNGKYVVFQIKGDSMLPNIPDNAKVLARMIDASKWEEVNGVVFVAYGKTLTIKRVLKNALYLNNTITLKADNPIYGQLDIARKEIRGIWKAERIVSQKIK